MYIDMAYSLSELRARGHDQFFEARHSGDYFHKVVGLYPLADRVTAVEGALERHRFSDRQDIIEARSAALGWPKWLFPIDFLLTQRRLVGHVARLMRQERISLIVATDPLYSGLFGLWLRRRTGRPLVIWLVANYDLNFAATRSLAMPRLFPLRFIEKAVVRYVLRRADLVAGGSGTLRDYALEQGAEPARTEVFRVVKNMIPARRLPPASERR
ncbi:glycosyltransferase family 4 protein [Sphingomonas sinipercae]|uniref:Glycosyltransferase family 4 protein n=1 Tax=Sphingomonas sinipercae TaxID=2714944 RepID=A0A6G7ZNC6_9SPHN|nr:glycosyltransferase [Sphingomonas sinipercae]QIL02428.1 glycosyltransferase family 4 protein [Sphingomonas sinipercae]